MNVTNNNLKRIEIPLGRKCQLNCFFCSEKDLIDFHKKKSLSFRYFSNLLIKAYKKGYNSLTITGGEATVEPNFIKAIKLAKKLNMHIQISTNGLMFLDERFVKEISSYINRITLSVQAITDKDFFNITGKKINNRIEKLNKILKNLDNYFISKKNSQLISNTVLNKKLSISKLQDIINYLYPTNIKEIHITYPDIDEAIGLNNIEYIKITQKESNYILNKLKLNNKVKLAGFPLCFIPLNKYKFIENYDKTITKLLIKETVSTYNREATPPRKRKYTNTCMNCIYKKNCRGRPVYHNKEGKLILV